MKPVHFYCVAVTSLEKTFSKKRPPIAMAPIRAQFIRLRTGLVASIIAISPPLLSGEDESSADLFYQSEIMPILEDSCYDCHDYESKKGGFSIDDYFTFDEVSQDKDRWFKVFKNVQAHVMPPPEKDPPSLANRAKILDWIKRDVFEIDPANPDPGQVAHRRLNRVEYENTLFELTGIEIDANDILPADDTGYGFDNIADALSLSPLHLEKYIKIANDVLEKAIPEEPYELPIRKIDGEDFRDSDNLPIAQALAFSESHSINASIAIDHQGTYRVRARIVTPKFFNFDYGQTKLALYLDGTLEASLDLKHSHKSETFIAFQVELDSGDHDVRIELAPDYDPSKIDSKMTAKIESIAFEGPIETKYKTVKSEYRRFFPEGPPPESAAKRAAYSRRVLEAFAYRAYRRPVNAEMLDRLVALAQANIEADGLSFEQGMVRAFTAILASPHFLYRIEIPQPSDDPEAYPFIDEYSLASRLSYFFWSNMPDEELLELASRGHLRSRLQSQIKRMLADEKAEALTENFVGQWLQSRDIPLIALNERAILAGDGKPNSRFRLTGSLRRAMRQETEMSFEHILKNDLSLLELIDADYVFLNAELAEHYGIEGVTHRSMKKVQLPPDSYRGGILTQATILGVTSNPTRTSPVKRGLFILENLLGTPTLPAPPDVPELEIAQKKFAADHVPNMRELMAVHREKKLCRSCHERMDPLGLALENFNAMGMWRDRQAGADIDPSGVLVTGEAFDDIRDLKRILANERRLDYYRVVSEKLMTYALGRGLDYYDTHTIDQLVETLETNDGRIMTLIEGIIHSPAFQKTRLKPIDSLAIGH